MNAPNGQRRDGYRLSDQLSSADLDRLSRDLFSDRNPQGRKKKKHFSMH